MTKAEQDGGFGSDRRRRMGGAALAFVVVAVAMVVVFTTTPAEAQTYSVVHTFTSYGPPGELGDGGMPTGLIRDAAGNLYGTTQFGGTYGLGTVFEIDTSGNETVLHSFTGQPDGQHPIGGVIRDSAGNLFGVAFEGSIGEGAVFKIDASGNESVLYSFKQYPDGSYPRSLIQDPDGNLYGTTQVGGTYGQGTVFKLDTAGNETVLYSFGQGGDGHYPNGGLIRDAAGNLYGNTADFGDRACNSQHACGALFKLDVSGSETVLHQFGFRTGDGQIPSGGIIGDTAGNLYGTTNSGGVFGYGTVFKLNVRTGKGRLLYSFTGGVDGSGPQGALVGDAAGSLYGTTEKGGTYGYGTVFKLDTSGNETVLYSFNYNFYYPTDGYDPNGLILDPVGNLFGITYSGGDSGDTSCGLRVGCGVVFKISFP